MPISFPKGASGTEWDAKPEPSGRRSPDPFKRFRRLSSTTNLNVMSAANESNPSSNGSSSIPVKSPPPKPSSSTKPAFIRNRRSKAGSISILVGSAIPTRNGINLDAVRQTPTQDVHQEAYTASSPQPFKGKLSAFSSRIHKGNEVSALPSSKSHSQAWYQAQQKTIDLDQPGRAAALASSSSLPTFPINVSSTHLMRDGPSRRPAVETFSSEEEMIAAGVHIIKRRDELSSANRPPVLPARLRGANEPDFLELFDSSNGRPEANRSSLDHGRSSFGFHSGQSDATIRPALPPRPSTSLAFNQHHYNQSASSLSSYSGSDHTSVREQSPSYLSPAPSTSAHPFLNKQSATMGKSSGAAAGIASARNGLASYYNASNVATLVDSSSRQRDEQQPPAKPKPKLSLLNAFPKSSSTTRLPVSSSPNDSFSSLSSPSWKTQPLSRLPDTPRSAAPILERQAFAASGKPESSADYHDRMRSLSSTPLPHPRRTNMPVGGSRQHAYSSSHSAAGVAGALGQVGQIGAAVGRKGWDFVRTFNSNSHAGGSGPSKSSIPIRVNTNLSPFKQQQQASNEPTRQWLAVLAEETERNRVNLGKARNGPPVPPPSAPRSGQGIIFGVALREAVLRTRLATRPQRNANGKEAHLSIPDFGNQFSLGMNFFDSPTSSSPSSPRVSRQQRKSVQDVTANREEARLYYLPGIVARCIESLENWGPQEEGIYRLSGRSSHTAKLRSVFDEHTGDLQLDQISPADLDINSVCSLLKSYLRELPEMLVPSHLMSSLERLGSRLLGSSKDAACISSEIVVKEVAPVMAALPSANWYLLRELAEHLGWLSSAEIVSQTKMPLSNLCLVLAPTLSISVMVLKLLIEHRAHIFKGPAPKADVELDYAFHQAQVITASGLAKLSPTSTVSSPSLAAVHAVPQPCQTLQPSKMRSRSSSVSLASLLDSPKSPRGHRSSNSYSSIPLRLDSSPLQERPQTSLGHHFDDNDEGAAPIARYYARLRIEEESLPPSPCTSTSRAETGALDRPRPPTSNHTTFFSNARSRRNESIANISAVTKPLNIMKKLAGATWTVSSSCSTNTISTSASSITPPDDDRKKAFV